MFMLNLILSSILYVMGVLIFVMTRKHLLSMLLSLEYIVLSLFLLLLIYLNLIEFESFFSMMFLIFSVCEGALGISILVSMIRTYGNDYFQSLNIL
uniref:NADH-ubiquinone oxidoreductase chain 4L n=1 Tax=Periscepsia handlirschi TaxID=2799180 RepID=A0A7T4X9L3_9MUSC|nr:NADH dehydrogenase subunit 4L [Periscepsia handlirschi]QQD89772.1 NADH dehydrogenase subunit 4L [Periscepsia handlirschi]